MTINIDENLERRIREIAQEEIDDFVTHALNVLPPSRFMFDFKSIPTAILENWRRATKRVVR